MKRLLAGVLLVPTASAVLAAPVSAERPAKAVCTQLFNTPDRKTVFGDVSEFGAIASGAFHGRYGVQSGSTVTIRFCLFHDEDEDRAFDAGERFFTIQQTSDHSAEPPDPRPVAERFVITITGVPEGDRVCYRAALRTTSATGTTKRTDVTRCLTFSA